MQWGCHVFIICSLLYCACIGIISRATPQMLVMFQLAHSGDLLFPVVELIIQELQESTTVLVYHSEQFTLFSRDGILINQWNSNTYVMLNQPSWENKFYQYSCKPGKRLEKTGNPNAEAAAYTDQWKESHKSSSLCKLKDGSTVIESALYDLIRNMSMNSQKNVNKIRKAHLLSEEMWWVIIIIRNE